MPRRRRYISTEISLDPVVNRLALEAGDFAALLYTWMIPHAEDDATVEGNPDKLLFAVCPGRRDKESKDVAAALAAMDGLGLIEWDGEHVAFPADSFYKYQTYVAGDRRRSDQGKRPKTPQNSAERRRTPQVAQNAASVLVSSSVSVSSSASKSKPLQQPREEHAALPPDQPWDGTIDEVRQHLNGLNGLAPEGFPVGQLYDPAFWLRIEASTEGSEVFYLDQLRSYLAWWAEQPPSKRHRNVRKGFGSWIRIELARDAGRKRRAQEQKQRSFGR